MIPSCPAIFDQIINNTGFGQREGVTERAEIIFRDLAQILRMILPNASG